MKSLRMKWFALGVGLASGAWAGVGQVGSGADSAAPIIDSGDQGAENNAAAGTTGVANGASSTPAPTAVELQAQAQAQADAQAQAQALAQLAQTKQAQALAQTQSQEQAQAQVQAQARAQAEQIAAKSNAGAMPVANGEPDTRTRPRPTPSLRPPRPGMNTGDPPGASPAKPAGSENANGATQFASGSGKPVATKDSKAADNKPPLPVAQTDSVLFYTGIGIAAVILAFAFMTFMRSQVDDQSRLRTK